MLEERSMNLEQPARLGPFAALREHLISERVVVGGILLNSLALVVLASVGEATPLGKIAIFVDIACAVFFILEAGFKISKLGWADYWDNGWNRFDFLVVLLSSPVLLTPFLGLHEFGAVLVLRLGRLFRLFRLLRFIPNRDHLMDGVRRSLNASIGVLLALGLLNFILSMGATFLFGRIAPEHFGNPLVSVYSLFKVFTVEGWYEIPDLLAMRAEHPVWGFIARLYFIGAVLVGGIVGLSLANAVFVDEMTMDNNRGLELKVDELQAEIRALREALLGAAAAPGAQPAVLPEAAVSASDCVEVQPPRSRTG
jgi:voltage-gated sodium channel